MRKLRILIADDHSLVRIGLKSMLGFQPDMEVVGEAPDGERAIELAAELKPDVVVMDLMMPGMNGADATKGVVGASPGTKVIVLTSFGSASDLARAVDNGASGAQSKEESTDRLLDAIRIVAAFSPELRQTIEDEAAQPPLTAKQTEILQSVVLGFSNKEIAAQFGISPESVKKHMSAILGKLGASTRAEAVGIALRRQLFKV